MAMEMTAVWKERKSRSPFPLFPHCLGKLAKTASFPHSHSLGDDLGFPSSPSSFNFNFNEKCYLHARYLLLPTCQFAQSHTYEGLYRLRKKPVTCVWGLLAVDSPVIVLPPKPFFGRFLTLQRENSRLQRHLCPGVTPRLA